MLQRIHTPIAAQIASSNEHTHHLLQLHVNEIQPSFNNLQASVNANRDAINNKLHDIHEMQEKVAAHVLSATARIMICMCNVCNVCRWCM